MVVVNGYKNFKPIKGPILITIGNFDGLHIGHSAILSRLKKRADEINGKAVLLTFDPHPIKVLFPNKPIELLTTKELKLKNLELAGVDVTIIEQFTKELSEEGAREFFIDILINGLKVKEIFIGYDFSFGKNREGTPELMKELGREFNIPVTVIPPVKVDNEIISSTFIRKILMEGNIDKSNSLLGRPYEISGEVVKGAGRGKELGYPTANIKSSGQVIPQNGIYITDFILDGSVHPSVTSIGIRPTFKESHPATVIETCVLDFNKKIYGKVVNLRFLKRIRDEEKFSTIDELKRAIAKDVEISVKFFKDR